jgi:succinyl-CoA synthetase alpha subunit
MSILINKDTKVITQGITGKTGQFHTRMCRDYANGKNCFVAGVNPKKAGEDFEGIPIYASVKEASSATGATVSVIYVPPAGAAAAIWEAVEADLDLAICITEGIPVRDMLEVRNRMKAKEAKGGKKTIAQASSRQMKSRSASCPATSTAKAALAWCPAPAP